MLKIKSQKRQSTDITHSLQCVLEFQKCSRLVAQQCGACDPGRMQALLTHQNTLVRHLKNEFFSRNLGQNMPKIGYFFGKKALNRRSAEGSAPEPPLASGSWGLYPQSNKQQMLCFCFFSAFAPIFHFNL